MEDLAFWVVVFGGSVERVTEIAKLLIDSYYPAIGENIRQALLVVASIVAGIVGVLLVGESANILTYAGLGAPPIVGLIVSGAFLGGFGAKATYELVMLVKAVRHFFENAKPTHDLQSPPNTPIL